MAPRLHLAQVKDHPRKDTAMLQIYVTALTLAGRIEARAARALQTGRRDRGNITIEQVIIIASVVALAALVAGVIYSFVNGKLDSLR